LGCVKSDPPQFEQILINLTITGRDAVPKGGSVAIETRNVIVAEANNAAPPPMIAGNYVMLAVSDAGIG
jgi:two-component system cell cycle sensor histidine kinase/response regulator CckA